MSFILHLTATVVHFLDWKVSGGHLGCSCIDASAVGQWNDESGQWCSGSCCWIRQLSINQEQQWRLRDVLYDGTTSLEPFNYSQKQLTCNFSPKYPYIIKQTGNENTQTYQLVVICLIKHQILVTYLQGNVVQLERRIYNHILRVQELICYFAVGVFTFSTVGINCSIVVKYSGFTSRQCSEFLHPSFLILCGALKRCFLMLLSDIFSLPENAGAYSY